MRLTALLVVLNAATLPGASMSQSAPRPNFVLINIDDLGYADIGPFGSTLNRTPNLERMAAEGRKLTSFYAAPVCSPSRAALMTGCYPKRVLPIRGVLFPGNAEGLAPDEVTVAEQLKSAGYRTGMVGKWHLGDQPEFLPLEQGFDSWLGLPYSNDMGPAADGVKSNFGDPLPAERPNPQPPLPLIRDRRVVKRILPRDQVELVSLYTSESLRFLRVNRERPFFLYVAHSAVHFPLYPGDRFRGKSRNGLYGDWVEEVDWSVGQILDCLRELKLDDRTLVLFTSDNGGTRRGVNLPFRGFKASTWEGGMRVPTIAWWPGRVPAGTSSDSIAGMIDILPTFSALAGAPLAPGRKLDGVDLGPALFGRDGDGDQRREFFYYRGLQLEAVRQGNWKLRIATDGAAGEAGRARLYDLAADPGESRDLSSEHAAVVARLKSKMDEMGGDLGLNGPAPRGRPLGHASNPKPLIGLDGRIRPGFEPDGSG